MIFYVSKGNNEVFFSFLAKKMVKFLHMSKKSSTFALAFEKQGYMVVLAQLVEHRIVVPSVMGSSPIFHPQTSFTDVFFLCKNGGCEGS